MGCKCREIKRIHKALTGEEGRPGLIARIIQGALLLVASIVVLPFVLIYIYISYIIKGEFAVKVPEIFRKKIM